MKRSDEAHSATLPFGNTAADGVTMPSGISADQVPAPFGAMASRDCLPSAAAAAATSPAAAVAVGTWVSVPLPPHEASISAASSAASGVARGAVD